MIILPKLRHNSLAEEEFTGKVILVLAEIKLSGSVY